MKASIFFAILSFSIFAFASSIGESDEVYLAVKRVPNDAVITQGRPGKQGVAGPIGPVGAKGEKGDVGRCVCDLSEVMELKQQIQALRNQLLPEEGWFAPGNGYQYLVTQSRQNWQDSRTLCQSMEGDLATFGVRNYDTRFIIASSIRHGDAPWIGLNDITTEGTFVWIDGVTATPENIHWGRGQPDNAGNGEDCGHLWGASVNYKSNDRSCVHSIYALCEKRLG